MSNQNDVVVTVADTLQGGLGNFNMVIPSAVGITIVFNNMQKTGNTMTFDSIKLVTITNEHIVLEQNQVSFY